MAASVRQEAPGNYLSAASTTAVSGTLSSAALIGSALEFWLLWDTSTTVPTSVVDSASQSYTFKNSIFDNNDSLTLAVYIFANNQSNTALSTTATWAASKSFRAAWLKEITGVTTSPYQTSAGQDQASPGTTAGAISSGNVTPTSAPALISSLSFGDGGNLSSSAVSPFTQGTTGWNLDGGQTANSTTSASLRVTNTSAIASTFTNTSDGGTRRFLTMSVVYSEALTGSTITPTVGSVTASGNQPTVTPATNTVIQTFVARHGSGVLMPPPRKIFLPPLRKAA